MKKRTDSLLVLEAFDDYFLARPLIDEIQFYRVAFEPKKAITYEIDREDVMDDPLYKLSMEVGFRSLAFNFNRETIIHKSAFRKAIYHLFDVKKMWNELDRSDLRESSSYFHWKSKSMEKNRNMVSSLLKESGYNGERLTIYTVRTPNFIEMAEWLKKEALKFEIQLEIKTFTLDQIYDSFIEEADLLFMGEVASTDHHLSFLGAFLNKAMIFNRFLTMNQLKVLNTYFDQMKQEKDKK